MILYQKAIKYARSLVGVDLAKDLVHDLYLSLLNRNIDLFATSNRFVYVALYNFNRSRAAGSMAYRHRVTFVDYDTYMPYTKTTPYDILVEKELRQTLQDNLLMKVDGYNVQEIGQLTGYSRISAGKQLRKAIANLSLN